MAVPANGPATLAGVKAYLGITDDRSDTPLTSLVRAVNVLVRTWPCCVKADGVADWTVEDVADLVLGANMLVARLWQRRNSPLGFEAIADQGAAYVSRNDPDVAMLLGLGGWQPLAGQVG
jgi:hypothetical protein